MLRDPIIGANWLSFFEPIGLDHQETGVFVCEALNLELSFEDKVRTESHTPYGVCDSPAQFRETSVWREIVEDDRPMALVFVPIRRIDQPLAGGWRWHKWGEYVGTHEPQHEYLCDEDIDVVYVFSTTELIDGRTTDDPA